MDRKTYDALVAGVEKWRANAKVKRRGDAQIYSDSCKLCELFLDQGCKGCPVRAATGFPDCYYTPWGDAYEDYCYGTLELFRKYAQREADFLSALVPAGGPDEP